MIKLTIKSLTSNDKKKDGTPLVGKFGPYFIIRADTQEEGYVSWFGKTASDLKAGEVIEGTLETSTSEVNGKTYTNKNFKFPNKDDAQTERIAKLEGRVMKLELSLERQFAELKADLVLEMTGKFQTTSDFKEMSKPHPLFKDEPQSDIPDFDENGTPF